MRTAGRVATVATAIAALATLGAGAVTAAPHRAAVDKNASITMAINAEPTFNLWSPNAYVESDNIDPLIFSDLTKFGLNGAPEGDLAQSWKTSKNGLTWTFQLRKGVKWQDGTPFTSADVVFTYEDIVFNKKLGANQASNFVDVKSVTADGKNAVQFHLDTPWASLPAYLGWFAPILPEHIFKGVKDPWTLASFDKQHPVGTGPYMVTNVVPNGSITLARNPNYYGKTPQIQTIIYQIVPEETTQIADLLSGDLNFIEVDEPQLVPKLKTDPSLTLQTVPEQNYYYMALNQRLPEFQNVKVRQALQYAINTAAIIKGLLRGYGQVSTGPIAPIQKYYYDPHVAKYPYNPKKALSLMEQAGYHLVNGKLVDKSGKPFTVYMPTGQYGYLVQASELIENYWQKLGVTVNFKQLEWNTFIQQVIVNHNFGASFGWWIAPLDPDVFPYYACSAAETGYNFQGTCDKQLDALMEKGRATASPAARKRIYDQVQQILAKNLYLNFQWYPEMVDASTSNLHVPSVNINIGLDNISLWYVTR